MRHKGSLSEFSNERMTEVMHAYQHYIAKAQYVDMKKVCQEIANTPASRFWVSDIWAAKIISAMLKGHTYKRMRPLKREMFEEIKKRVIKLRETQPNWSIAKCCEVVVTQNAPKHYLSPGSLQVLICKERKRRRLCGKMQ